MLGEAILYNGNLKIPNRESLFNKDEITTSMNRLELGKPIAYVANYVKQYKLNRNEIQLLTFGNLQCGTKISVLINGITLYIDIFPMKIINLPHDSPEKQELIDIEHSNITNTGIIYERMMKYKLFTEFVACLNAFGRDTRSNNQNVIYNKIFNIGVQPTMIGYRVYYPNCELLRNAVYNYGSNISAYMKEEFFLTSYSNTDLADLVGARQGKYFGSWMMLRNYKRQSFSNQVSKLDQKYNYVVRINDYVCINNDNISELGITEQSLMIYKSLHLAIDIETADIGTQENIKSENNNKGILSESNDVFNIACVLAVEDKLGKPSLRINIINTQVPVYVNKQIYKKFAIDGQITIVTNNTRDTLLAFIQLIKELKPDFVYGYNSLDFDIPQILLSLRHNNLFDQFYENVSLMFSDRQSSYKNEYIIRDTGCKYRYNSSGYTYWYNMKTTSQVSGISGIHKAGDIQLKINNGKLPQIKIKTNMKNYHEIDIPGIIMLDVMLISWQQYPLDNAKGGMNYYLAKNKLQPKLDMPYYKIWLFYFMTKNHDIEAIAHRTGDADNNYKYWLGETQIEQAVYEALEEKPLVQHIHDIIEYCSYDAEGAMLLLNRYNFMGTKRAFCKLVNLPFYKIIYRADGSKVENSLRKTLVDNNYVLIEECLNGGSEENYSQVKIRKIAEANPNAKLYHIKQKAPKNTGGYVAIHMSGKIMATFYVDGKSYRKEVPIDALDFASLYPSIIMAYNLCYSTIVLDRSIAEYYHKYRGYDIHELPAIRLLNESEFPKEMNEYYTKFYRVANFADSTIYILQHSNDRSKYGIFAKNLGQFFDMRGKIKKIMGSADELAKKIVDDRVTDPEFINLHKLHIRDGGKLNIKEFAEKYSFDNDINYVNAILVYNNENLNQLCVKVVMNTLYGTLDYVDSPIYSPLIASIITFYGRYYVKESDKFCKENGRTPVYNDTDSTYYYHPLEVFQSTVERYVRDQITKEEYNRRMVHKSMKHSFTSYQLIEFYKSRIEMFNELHKNEVEGSEKWHYYKEKVNRLRGKISNKPEKTFADRINEYFAEQSKGPFLKQIREETLYPAIFCGLKKYFGLKHEAKFVSNYSISDVLFRGLKIRVANATKYEKEFTWKVVKRIIDDGDIKEIIYDELDKALQSDVDYSNLDLYENTARYKSKKGKSEIKGMIRRFEKTRNFVGNLRLQYLLRTPFELENIYYVFTKCKTPYTITGLVNKPKKQDLNEYRSVVEYLHNAYKSCNTQDNYYEIDIARYVTSVAATCAQLLSYDKSYGYTENMEFKVYISKIADSVRDYCKTYYNNTEAEKAKVEEFDLYKKFIKNRKAIDFVVSDYVKDYPDLYTAVMRMVDLSTKLKYTDKVENLARAETNIAYRDYIDDELLKELDLKIDDYALTITHIMDNIIRPAFINIGDYINYMRDVIVDHLFDHTKELLRNNIKIVDNKRILATEILYVANPNWVKLDKDLAERLYQCEYVITSYIGLSAISKYVSMFIHAEKDYAAMFRSQP